jgi:hypothetical protein
VKLRVVHILPKRALTGLQIWLVSVRGDLRTPYYPALQIPCEVRGPFRIAPADQIRDAQLRVGIERDPRPHITPALQLLIGGGVLGFGTAEGPNFIRLDSSSGDIADVAMVIRSTGAPHVFEQLQDSVLCRSRHADDGVDAAAFY